MAGQSTPIISIDYNSIQSKISQILGIGAGNYGYGQDVLSSQIRPRSIITRDQWNNLRIDLLKARQHQTGIDESGNLPIQPSNTIFTNSDVQKFSNFVLLVESNRLATPPSSQATRENLVIATRTTPWNNILTHSVTVQFASQESARWYFNTGSVIEISASRTSGISNLKNTSWSNLLSNMGTIKFDRVQTTSSTGQGTGSLIGYYNLTTSNQLIYRKYATTSYTSNQYSVYAKIGSNDSIIVFTIEFSDLETGPFDENIDGILTSTIQVFRASGTNVSVPRPAVSSTFTGGEIVITPPDPIPNPSYSITPTITSIGEGETAVTFNIVTQNVPNGTTLFWTTEISAGITSADFEDNALSGSVLILGNKATVNRSAIKDTKTEGTETFKLELRSDSVGGPILAASLLVEILDLSTDPIPSTATYELLQSATIMVEGSSEGVIFTVNTTNVPNGTTLFWTTNVGEYNITTVDFADNSLNGYVTIRNNTGSFSRAVSADHKTEGSEIFFIELRTISTSGNIVAISNPILILDISLTPSIGLDAYPLYPNEGGIITVSLDVSYIAPNTPLYLTSTGSISDADLLQLSGPTINSVTKQFMYTASPTEWQFQIQNDSATEGTENIIWQTRIESKTSEVVATSPTVYINDTSRTSAYALVVDPISVNEGGTVTTTLTMANVSPGTTLYLTLSSSSTAKYADLVYNTGPTINVDRSFIVSGNSMVWTHNTVADSTTEGPESFNWVITTDPEFTKVVATSNSALINDTSRAPSTYSIIAVPVGVVEGVIVSGPGVPTIMDSPVENLVAYWVMDESDGSNLNDKIDNTNQIAKGGTIGWGSINTVPAAFFSGSSTSYAIVTKDTDKLQLTATAGSSYTIEAWIYPTGNGQDAIYGGEIINHDSDFEVARRPNGQIMVASDWGIGTDVSLPGGGWIIPPPGIAIAPLNTATHFAVVIANSELKIYINGSLEWTKTGLNRLVSNHPNNKTYIGNRTSKTQGFKGYINNLRVWNIARTDDQINAWYNTTSYPGIQQHPAVISSAGNSVAFNITTTNVPDSTTLYWGTIGLDSGLNQDDFVDQQLTGTVEINRNFGLITRSITADAQTEGSERFQVALYSDEAREILLATSQTVTIDDTSTKAAGSIEYTQPGPEAYVPFVVPSGVTSITVEMAGGGGSGGYSYRLDPQCAGGGGGSGGFKTSVIAVTPGQNIKVNVGAGGIASFEETSPTRNGEITSIAIGTSVGTVTYGGTPYPPVSHPAWTNATIKSYAVWMAGLFQRNIFRWDLYITTAGTYTIKGAADDSMTMWIDNEIVLNGVAGFNKSTTTSVSKSLTTGIHSIIISGKDSGGVIAGVSASIQLGSSIIWHTRMGPDAAISAGVIHVSGGMQGNDGMAVGNNGTAGRGGIRGMPAGQDGTIGEKVPNTTMAHPGVSPKGTAWGGTGGTSHYGPGGEGGKGTVGSAGEGYGAGGGGAGAQQLAGSKAKVALGGDGVGGYIKISWGQ